MRSRRNHRELWEQLRAIITYGKQQRYNKRELYDLMYMLELGQLAQDPIKAVIESARKYE